MHLCSDGKVMIVPVSVWNERRPAENVQDTEVERLHNALANTAEDVRKFTESETLLLAVGVETPVMITAKLYALYRRVLERCALEGGYK